MFKSMLAHKDFLTWLKIGIAASQAEAILKIFVDWNVI